MPGRDTQPTLDDWTRGPAKWFAAGVLGMASIGLGVWSGLTRLPAPHAATIAPTQLSPASNALGPASHSGEPRLSGSASAASLAPSIAGIDEGRINLNAATRAELDMLPGIGPTLADRIIHDREAHGPFASIEDLERVSGIGPRTVERVRALARVD